MLKKFLSRLSGGPKSSSSFFKVYVQCDRCDEKIFANINLHNDLSIRYGETDNDNTYFVRKQLLGRRRCFNPVDIELTFDNKRKLIDQQISGGHFITEDEFSAEQHDQQSSPAS